MINRRLACAYMELNQQCTDICSEAGFLRHPSSKSFQYLYPGLGFSPVLPLFNLLSSYLYISIISLTRIYLFSSISLPHFYFIFTYHTSHILSFPSSLYLPTSLPYFPPPPSLTPLTHSSHPPDAVSHPSFSSTHLRPAIYIDTAAPLFLG